MNNKYLWLMFAMLTLSCSADAYRILVVFPFPSKSHTILGEGVVRLLLEAGHEVTYITPATIKQNSYPKLRQVDVSENFDLMPREEYINLRKFLEASGNVKQESITHKSLSIFRLTFNNPNVQKLCKDPKENFDVIITEWMYCEPLAAFSAIFKAPFIWFSTTDPHWAVLDLIDQRSNPAYNAHISSHTSPPFTFYERVEQLVHQIIGQIMKKIFHRPIEEDIYTEIQALIRHRGHEVPDFEELRYNASLMLGNSHVSLGSAISLPQNYKPIVGYHIDPKVEKLPQELQKIMDNARHGVIYFSMGTNLKSQSLPDEVKRDLMQMFGKLKQTVIWKFEEVLPGTPINVKVLQWAPQHNILAHPNCVLFITHGGLLSITEAVHFGKPIIGIPVFGDQYLNVQRSVKRGFARKVDLSFALADDLKEAIDEVLNDTSYSMKAMELSVIYHHRPVAPGAELVHWVEHVALTKGAAHLRSPALDLPFYKKYFLDLLVLIIVLQTALYLTTKRIFRKINVLKQIKQMKND